MTRRPLALSMLMAGLSCSAADAQDVHSQHHAGAPAEAMRTPPSLAAEHRHLHEILARAATEGGDLGSAAHALEEALAPHFKREEEIATPPLSLLPRLARGNATPDMRAVLPMTDALERELPQMLKDHAAIRDALSRFRAAATKAGRDEYVRFSDQLTAHAGQEEEILYPAAILVGRYVKRTAPGR